MYIKILKLSLINNENIQKSFLHSILSWVFEGKKKKRKGREGKKERRERQRQRERLKITTQFTETAVNELSDVGTWDKEKNGHFARYQRVFHH